MIMKMERTPKPILIALFMAAILLLTIVFRDRGRRIDRVETRVERLEPKRAWLRRATDEDLKAVVKTLAAIGGAHALREAYAPQGVELRQRVRNNTGAAILDRARVYINGAEGHMPTVAPVPENQPLGTRWSIGLAEGDIEPGDYGLVLLDSCTHGQESSENRIGKIDGLTWPCCGRDVWITMTPPVRVLNAPSVALSYKTAVEKIEKIDRLKRRRNTLASADRTTGTVRVVWDSLETHWADHCPGHDVSISLTARQFRSGYDGTKAEAAQIARDIEALQSEFSGGPR